MLVLGIDAATDTLSLALGRPGGDKAIRSAVGARRHAGLLGMLVADVLAESGAGLGAVDAIAVSNGPGSFTGLRVAAAWAKGVARPREIPIWTASTLLVRAMAIADGTVLGVGPALRHEWFVAGYRFAPAGPIETVVPPGVVGVDWRLPTHLTIDAVVGTAVDASAPWADVPVAIPPPEGLPSAGRLIDLIGRKGGATLIAQPAHWEPEYGRPAEAQAKWEREHGRRLPDQAGQAG